MQSIDRWPFGRSNPIRYLLSGVAFPLAFAFGFDWLCFCSGSPLGSASKNSSIWTNTLFPMRRCGIWLSFNQSRSVSVEQSIESASSESNTQPACGSLWTNSAEAIDTANLPLHTSVRLDDFPCWGFLKDRSGEDCRRLRTTALNGVTLN